MTTLLEYPFHAMGGDCSLRLIPPHGAEGDAIAQLAIAEVERIEAAYSRYRSDNTLARINAVGKRGGSIDLDEETAGLIEHAFACYRLSDGLFDITTGLFRSVWDFNGDLLPAPEAIAPLLPRVGLRKVRWDTPFLSFAHSGMEIDLGGVAKEYAADRVVAILREQGVESGLIELAGDIAIVGPLPNHAPWRIGVADPKEPTWAAFTLEVEKGGVATSGDYARCIDIDGVRYGHILDPRTGWPIKKGLVSVTVVADTCMAAGSVSTIALLKGPAGKEWLASLSLPHRWIDADGAHGGHWPDGL